MSNGSAKRDVLAGACVSAIGVAVVFECSSLELGTLRQMQAGYFPVALGIMLTGLGVLIAISGVVAKAEPTDDTERVPPPDLRGCTAIILSIIAFVGLGAHFGLVPATFFSVLIAAAGDRQTTVKGALALALVLVVVAICLFSYALKVPFPLVRW